MAFLDHTPASTLFHYCSVEGFHGIIESKRLWMSELTTTNDPREIKFGLDKALEAIQELRHGPSKGNQGAFLTLLWSRLEGFSKNSHLFTACFTPFGDELPMWQGYTPDASGLSIGFRPRAIIDMHGRLQRVEYVAGDDRLSITAAVRAVADVFPESTGIHDDLFWIEAVALAYSKISMCKHESWAYEREVRLCYSQPRERLEDFLPISLTPDQRAISWIEPKSRLRGTERVLYVEMPYGKWVLQGNDPAQAIEQVVLGPRCSISIDEVTQNLKNRGFRCFTVRHSDCRIR